MVLRKRESRKPPPYIGEGPIGTRKPFLQKKQYRKAVIAQGLHLLPFRTEKLNLVTPMVLRKRESRKLPPYTRTREAISRVLFYLMTSFLSAFSDIFSIVSYYLSLSIAIFRYGTVIANLVCSLVCNRSVIS